jgi:hypothetical protein
MHLCKYLIKYFMSQVYVIKPIKTWRNTFLLKWPWRQNCQRQMSTVRNPSSPMVRKPSTRCRAHSCQGSPLNLCFVCWTKGLEFSQPCAPTDSANRKLKKYGEKLCSNWTCALFLSLFPEQYSRIAIHIALQCTRCFNSCPKGQPFNICDIWVQLKKQVRIIL